METRDKVLILIVAAWIAAAVYFKTTTDRMFDRMDVLEKEQLKHVEQVNGEFRKDLHNLDLRFIGRGKHLRKAQKDIVDNRNLTLHKADTLLTNIEMVQFNLDEYGRRTDVKLGQIDQSIEKQRKNFNSFKRMARFDIDDLSRRLKTAETDIEIAKEDLRVIKRVASVRKAFEEEAKKKAEEGGKK